MTPQRILRAARTFTLVIVGLFAFATYASAGTLTNFSFSADDYSPGTTTDYTFSYTIETSDPTRIFYTFFPVGFDLGNSTATVTINGNPATISEFSGNGDNGGADIILLDTTVASGSNIVVVLSNIVNPVTPGTYQLFFVITADGGGNAVDSPVSIDDIVIADPSFSGNGAGTELDPYQITSCVQLQEMNYELDADYILVNNVDCSDTQNWNGGEGFAPIGTSVSRFTGSFDGKGFVINGLFISRGNSGVGLFGHVATGVTIKNVWLENVDISGTSDVGAIIGVIGQTGITAPSYLLKSYAQGIVNGGNAVGGLVGAAYSLHLENSYFQGTVEAVNYDVGGLVGYSEDIVLENSYFVGTVTSTNYTPYGLIGWAAGTSPVVTESFWDRDVSGTMDGSGAVNLGTSKTTLEMKSTETFTNAAWNFSTIWNRADGTNGDYPFLRNPSDEEVPEELDGDGTLGVPWILTECFTVEQSGYYTLGNNIPDAIGTCIIIEADDVFINGAGYTITGDSQESSVGIFSEGYDRVALSNITLTSFDDGIKLYNVQGTSIITNVTIQEMEDDGIELYGISEMTVSSSTLTDIGDRGIIIRRYYDQNNDEMITNADITIQDVTISDTGDFGIEFDYVTDFLVAENEIFNTNDDGINGEVIENGEIRNNSIYDVDSDGIYIEGNVNVLISGNTITNVDNGDGIDIDEDGDGNYDVTITNNVITNVSDNGIEITDLYGGIITGNTMSASDGGIDINSSEDIQFSGNTITPTIDEYFEIPTVTIESVTLDILDADNSLNSDYNSFTYALPFTFNFKGRDITDIQVNTHGSIELLEDGESCQICSSDGYYEDYLVSDTLFASFDSLSVAGTGDYVAVFSPNDEYVVVEWKGTTQYDYNSELYPIHFQVIMYPNGTVKWNFIEMNFQSYYYGMFTGAYDVETGDVYKAGLAINETASYRADFSGDTDYELTESFNPIIGIDLSYVSNSSFVGNSIHANRWITNIDSENVVFNDSDSGNTYRLLNGAGAWTIFDIIDTDGNGYAESGTDRPFNQTILGSDYWNGEGEDAYPASLSQQAPVVSISGPVTSSGSTLWSQEKSRRDWDAYYKQKNAAKDDDAKKTPEENQEKISVKDSPATCPADQTLTQNLRSGARNGRYHNYTKSVVKEAKILQAHLNRLGFKSGPTDGILGRLSDGAIKRMQTFLGTKADGFVGPQTRALINKSCGAGGLKTS